MTEGKLSPEGEALAQRFRPRGVPTPASVFPRANATKYEEPPIPVPDGHLLLKTIHGVEHTYQYASMPNGWRPHQHFLAISRPTGSKKWPWHQILWFETFDNSAEYKEALRVRKQWEQKQLEEAEGACDA